MKLIATTCLSFAFLLALPAGTADAQQPGPQAAAPDLQACVQACMANRHICIQGMAKNLDVVCAGIAECGGVSANDKASFNVICDACAKSETTYCVAPPSGPSANAGNGSRPPPPKAVAPATTPQVVSPDATCRQRGGIWVDGTCFTQLGARAQLIDHEKRLRDLEKQVMELRANGRPVPAEVTSEISTEIADTQKILDSMKDVGGLVSEYSRGVEDLVVSMRHTMAEQVRRLDGRIDEQARLQQVRDSYQDQAIADKVVTGSVRGALTGWSIGPYYGRQAYHLYDQALNAVGGEVSVFWSVSDTGKTRLALNAGGGYGGKYFGDHLSEIHGHFGLRHSWDAFSLTVGPGFNWRSDGLLNQAKAAWFGGIIEPRVTFKNGQGHGFYLYGLTGLGVTWYAREPIEFVHKTATKFDMPIMLGMGYEFLP